MKKTRRVLLQALACSAWPLAVPTASAAEYPSKPIRIIIPFPPASVPNVLLRSVTAVMATELGTSFVLDNKPGGNMFIGMGATANAEPDGYTLGQTTNTSDAINPQIYRKLPYDPDKLVPLGIVGVSPYVLIVSPQLNVNSVAELIQLIKSKPNGYNFGSAGTGGGIHLLAEKFSKENELKMEHVKFSGSSPAHLSMMQGDVHVYFDVLTSALPRLREGRLKALAVCTEARFPGLPDVPTMAELGHPGYVMTAWYALQAPRGTPAPVMERLSTALNNAVAQKSLRDQYEAMGMVLGPPGKPQDMVDRIAADKARWGAILKRVNVTME